jgi:hypothetical protein
VFNAAEFVSGYVLFTVGTTVGSLALLIPPQWRKAVFHDSEEVTPRSKAGYFANRFVAGVGSFLVVFAVSRANPAVVESISGVRYVVIFLGAYLITRWRPRWFKEDFSRTALVVKIIGTGLVVAGLVLVGVSGGHTGTGPS